MAIDGISGSSSAQSAMAAYYKQRQQDFSALGQALSAGNLAGAQKAFAALQTDLGNIKAASQNAGAQNGTGGSTGDLFAALKKALDSGDVAGAQKAFAALVQARTSQHRPDAAQAAAAGTTTGGTDADGDDDGTVGSTISVRA